MTEKTKWFEYKNSFVNLEKSHHIYCSPFPIDSKYHIRCYFPQSRTEWEDDAESEYCMEFETQEERNQAWATIKFRLGL